jgi:hypothetical protein
MTQQNWPPANQPPVNQPPYQHPPDNRGAHPIDIVPPPTTPLTIDTENPVYGDDVPFWRPGLTDTMKHLGWRWIMFLPAIAILLAIIGLPWYGFTPVLFWGGGKLLIFSIGLAITTTGGAIKSAMKQRKDPFCIHCGYDLIGLPDGHLCPECGRPFALKLIDEYRRDPHWFAQRYKHRKDRPLADDPFIAGTVVRKKSRDGT